MKKYAMFALVGLLIVSLIINVDLLLKQNHTQTSQPEVSGAYDLFLSDLRHVQLALDEYLKSTDQDDKTISMFKLIKQSDAAYYDIQELNRKLYETYGETLPLGDVIFNISMDAFHRAIDSVEKNNTSQLQTLKEQVDSLLNSLNSTKIIDKESFKRTETEINEFLKLPMVF